MQSNTNVINSREVQEQKELENLSPFAAKSINSKGRAKKEEPCFLRTEFQRDRDRIIHSKAFRRLKHKTQVFFSPTDDHFRTRMTHTLEVSQIARTIARALNLNEDLAEAIALGHDLGHTPFGHSGEDVLNEIMDYGFKHAKHSVRVATIIEDLNLTEETLDGILNHSGSLKKESPAFTLEGKIVKLSDKIAYINHDIDDAIRARIIKESDLPQDCVNYFSVDRSERITKMVADIIQNSFGKDKICMSEETFYYIDKLRTWMFKEVYTNKIAKQEENKVKGVIYGLFNYYESLLKKEMPNLNEDEIKQTVCDYIAGMTDRYAIQKYKDIYIPQSFQRNSGDEFLFTLAKINNKSIQQTLL